MNYTDQDLQFFEKLRNFNKYKSDFLERKNKQNTIQSTNYTISDIEHFKKLINTSPKKYSNNNFTKTNDLISVTTHMYNQLDNENFNKIKQFHFNSNIDSHIHTNKKNNSTFSTVNYTDNDLETFDHIIKTKNYKIINKLTANIKNNEDDNLKLINNQKNIKIMDFDKIKTKEKLDSKRRGKKIKVMYFD